MNKYTGLVCIGVFTLEILSASNTDLYVETFSVCNIVILTLLWPQRGSEEFLWVF